jgi:chromate transporter
VQWEINLRRVNLEIALCYLFAVPDKTEIADKFVSGKPQSAALREVTVLFLRLGFTAFGGPAAHIAMMEDEAVRRRNWLARDQFLDLLGVTSLIPGPSSTELAILLGYRRAGWRGLVIGGVCFILPAALIVAAIAWAYVAFGKLPQVIGVLSGVKPIIIAILLQALWRMGKIAIKGWWIRLIALLAIIANFAGVSPLAVLVGCGIAAIPPEIARRFRNSDGIAATFAAIAPAAKAGTALMPFKLSTLFLVFLKIGAVLFGSGYVLLAFLRGDFVDHLHWLSAGQLLDAVAVGQVTPGPVFTTATFIGYVLGRWRGAAVATIGIFLPSFIFVALSARLIPHIRRSPIAGAFLDGVIAGSLALMAVVTVSLGRAAMIDWPSIILGFISIVALMGFELNSIWLIALGAAAGCVRSLY